VSVFAFLAALCALFPRVMNDAEPDAAKARKAQMQETPAEDPASAAETAATR
jgi:hypothetical protein